VRAPVTAQRDKDGTVGIDLRPLGFANPAFKTKLGMTTDEAWEVADALLAVLPARKAGRTPENCPMGHTHSEERAVCGWCDYRGLPASTTGSDHP